MTADLSTGRFLLCAFVALLTRSAHAQDLGARGGVPRDLSNGSFSLVTENDLYTFATSRESDRFYTNGIFLHSSWSSPVAERHTRGLALPPFEPADYRTYFGFGLSHELHTPATINACAARYDDPLATVDDPRAVDPTACAEADAHWAREFAKRDRPFAAVWSAFFTFQRHAHLGAPSGLFTQYRLWSRFDLGTYGRTAGFGYEVQKNWHGFINDAIAGEDPATIPTGWRVPNGRATSSPLVQASSGIDLNIIRIQEAYLSDLIFPGVELDTRARALLLVPRNHLAIGFAFRAGLLPEHSSAPKRKPDLIQPWALYVETTADAALIITDLTYGGFADYRHIQDTYAAGLVFKLFGLQLSASLTWEALLYKNALELYPSTARVTDRFHRYGRIAAQLTY
jgi:hypothetical protein